MNARRSQKTYENEIGFSTDEEDLLSASERPSHLTPQRGYYSNIKSQISKLFNINKKVTKVSIPGRDISSMAPPNKRIIAASLNEAAVSENEDDDLSAPVMMMVNLNDNARVIPCPPKHSFFLKPFYAIKWIFLFFIGMFMKTLRALGRAILFIYHLLVSAAMLPLKMWQRTIKYLKCYTNSSYILLIPLKLLPAILIHLVVLVKRLIGYRRSSVFSGACQSQCVNDNNNTGANVSYGNWNFYRGNFKYIWSSVLGLCLIIVVGLYCAKRGSEGSTITSKQYNYLDLKPLVGRHLYSLYMLPGERCMTAGRCCKGNLEGLLRWLVCFSTIPFQRILLIFKGRHTKTTTPKEESYNVREFIDAVAAELEGVREEINLQERLILQIHDSLRTLEHNFLTKENTMHELIPKIQSSARFIEEMRREVDLAMSSLRHVSTLQKDTDQIVATMSRDADESIGFTKESVSNLHQSIDQKQQQVQSQIAYLETLLTDHAVKTKDKNQKALLRILEEINLLKELQEDVRSRINPLMELPLKFKEMSDRLKMEIRNKLSEEMAHHEQKTRFIEQTCIAEGEKLDQEFNQKSSDLVCFINKTIEEEGHVSTSKLRKDISISFLERTTELVRHMIEKMLPKRKKAQVDLKDGVKKCGLLAHLFNVNDENIPAGTNSEPICEPKETSHTIPKRGNKRDSVDEIIDNAIRLLAADDIGLADYALESSGGSVMADRSSPTYSERAAFLSLFGFTFGKVVKSIRKVIQAGSLPGECWAFKKDKGHVVIRLARAITISAITIDHVSSLLTPDGKILSAPKNIIVHALGGHEDEVGVPIGEFEYSLEGGPIQTFYLNETLVVAQYVKVNFLSNHGNEEYTCVYRVRVHGRFIE